MCEVEVPSSLASSSAVHHSASQSVDVSALLSAASTSTPGGVDSLASISTSPIPSPNNPSSPYQTPIGAKKKQKQQQAQLEEYETKKKQFDQLFASRIPFINACFLRAIRDALLIHLDAWINQVIKPGVLLWNMLVHLQLHDDPATHHLTTIKSPSVQMRQDAHSILHHCCKNQQLNIRSDDLKLIATDNNDDGSVHHHCAVLYSKRVSQTAWRMISDVMVELDRMMDMMDERSRTDMLGLVAPWCAHYGKLLLSNDYVACEIVLDSLWNITKKYHDVNGSDINRVDQRPSPASSQVPYRHLIMNCWTSLTRGKDECDQVMSRLTDYILDQYALEYDQYRRHVNQGNAAVQVHNASILNQLPINNSQRQARCVMAYVARQDAKSVVKQLCKYQRDYQITSLPDAYELALNQLYQNGMEDYAYPIITHKELSSMHLLVHVAYEHGDEAFQVEQLALVIVNALVLFTQSQADKSIKDAMLLLNNLTQSRIHEPQQIIDHFDRPSLTRQLATVSWRWVTQTNHKKIALHCYQLFLISHDASHYDDQMIQICSMNLFHAIRNKDDSLIHALVSVLLQAPAESCNTSIGIKFMTQIGFYLLLSWNVSIFQLGLVLIDKMIMCALDAQELNKVMMDTWSCDQQDDESVDVSIARVMSKGLTHPETINHTMQLLCTLCARLKDSLVKPNHMISTLLMMHVMDKLSNKNQGDKMKQLDDLLDPRRNIVDVSTSDDFYALFRKTTTVESFCDTFAQIYGNRFGNRHGNYVMWLLCKLMTCCESYRIPAIIMLSRMLPVLYQGNTGWSIADFAQLSSIVRECMVDSNAAFANAAVQIMHFLQSNLSGLDDKQIHTIFVFMRPLQGYDSIKAKQLDHDTFIGAVAKERDLARGEMLRRMWVQMYDLKADPTNNPVQYEMLLRMMTSEIKRVQKVPTPRVSTSPSTATVVAASAPVVPSVMVEGATPMVVNEATPSPEVVVEALETTPQQDEAANQEA
ncbi:hypothetical protein AKO1_009582 [Acrasis kona]|uniref:Uncharacterized protein n=1 Tax=Acrasis kona TaxID=1008807 RepID=A0AAW2YQ18_9EUKA